VVYVRSSVVYEVLDSKVRLVSIPFVNRVPFVQGWEIIILLLGCFRAEGAADRGALDPKSEGKARQPTASFVVIAAVGYSTQGMRAFSPAYIFCGMIPLDWILTPVKDPGYDIDVLPPEMDDYYNVNVSVTVNGLLPKDAPVELFWGDSNGDIVGPILDSWVIASGAKDMTSVHTTPGQKIKQRPIDSTRLYVRSNTQDASSELDPSNHTAWKTVPRTFLLCAGVDWPDELDSNGKLVKGLKGGTDAKLVQAAFMQHPFVYPVTPSALGLESTDAGTKSILKSLLSFPPTKAVAGDAFVLFISTHGSFEAGDGGEGAVNMEVNPNNPLLTVYSTADEFLRLNNAGSILLDDELTDWFNLKEWNDINKLVILDACYSGGFWGPLLNAEGDLHRLPKIALVAAASDGKYAYSIDGTEPGRTGEGYLTKAVEEVVGNANLLGKRISFNDFTAQLLARQGKDYFDLSGKVGLIMSIEEFWYTPVPVRLSISVQSTGDFDLEGLGIQPVLKIERERSTGHVIVAWGLHLQDYVLQSSHGVGGPWTREMTMPSAAGTQIFDAAGKPRFFRLALK
jgi:hypothetical protein